jgi:hypothetical protein
MWNITAADGLLVDWCTVGEIYQYWNSNQVMSLELEATPVNSDLDNTWSKDDIEDECKVEEPKVCRVSNRQKKRTC